MNPDTKIARTTGWIGILPFAGLPVVAWLGTPDWLQHWLVVWAMLLLAFWAGTLWMRHLADQPERQWLMAASLALVLAAWPAVLLPFHWALFWLAALYGAHLFIDEPWRAQGQPAWYRRLRLVLALITIAVLIVSGLIGAAVVD